MGLITGIRYSEDRSNIELYRYEYTNNKQEKKIIYKTLDEMVLLMKTDKIRNVQTKGGAKVVARLTTVADGKQSNNLENLPEF